MMIPSPRDGPLPAAPTPHFLQQSSIEVIAGDAVRFFELAPDLRPSAVFVPTLPGEDFATRLAAIRAVRAQGLEPVPHISARRLSSSTEWRDQLARLSAEAGVTRLLLIGGDPDTPLGPYVDSLSVIRDTDFAAAGIRHVGLAGHPEGHSAMSGRQPIEVLRAKIAALQAQGVSAEITTQFSFDPDLVPVGWPTCGGKGWTSPWLWGYPAPPR